VVLFLLLEVLAEGVTLPVVGRSRRRRSGWPSNSTPRRSKHSRSCQLAVDQTFTTAGIAGSPRSRKALRTMRCFCVYEYTW
jgi:hypothetical protein